MSLFELQRVSLATGVELDVVDVGDRDKPVVILLHGFPESHRTWRFQIPVLSEKFRVIVPDQRGYGHSSKPEGVENYSIDKLVADVFALADALGVDSFTLGAHDWGGGVAWAAALHEARQFPQEQASRVERLVILNSPHPVIFANKIIHDPEQRYASQYIRDFRDVANDEVIAQIGFASFLEKTIRWGSVFGMDEQEQQMLQQYWDIPGAATAMLNWYRAAEFAVPEVSESVEDFKFVDEFVANYKAVIDIPVLIIWAVDDLALRPSLLQGVDQFCADVKVHRIADCGHFVQWQKPEQVNKALLDWLG